MSYEISSRTRDLLLRMCLSENRWPNCWLSILRSRNGIVEAKLELLSSSVKLSFGTTIWDPLDGFRKLLGWRWYYWWTANPNTNPGLSGRNDARTGILLRVGDEWNAEVELKGVKKSLVRWWRWVSSLRWIGIGVRSRRKDEMGEVKQSKTMVGQGQTKRTKHSHIWQYHQRYLRIASRHSSVSNMISWRIPKNVHS
jgi:hypothetical protein